MPFSKRRLRKTEELLIATPDTVTRNKNACSANSNANSQIELEEMGRNISIWARSIMKRFIRYDSVSFLVFVSVNNETQEREMLGSCRVLIGFL